MAKNERSATELDIQIGKRIREARKLQGVSQEKLAAAVELTFQQIQKYERGLNRVSTSRLVDISRVLHMPILWFIGIMDDTSAQLSAAFARLEAENVSLRERLSNISKQAEGA